MTLFSGKYSKVKRPVSDGTVSLVSGFGASLSRLTSRLDGESKKAYSEARAVSQKCVPLTSETLWLETATTDAVHNTEAAARRPPLLFIARPLSDAHT